MMPKILVKSEQDIILRNPYMPNIGVPKEGEKSRRDKLKLAIFDQYLATFHQK